MERVELTKNTIIFTVLFIVTLIVLYFSRYIVLISLVGLGIGVLVNPVLDSIRRKVHLPRALSALIVLTALLLIFLAVMGSLYFLVADQVSSLDERWPNIKETSEQWMTSLLDRFPWLQEQIIKIDFGKYFSSSAKGLLQGFTTGFVALSGGIFVLIIGLYTAVNGGEYFEKTIQAFFPDEREKARMVLCHCAKVVRAWFKAQLIDMVIIGTLTSFGLWIAGIEYWAVFGLLTAVLGIIPYIGIILVVIVASLITLSTDPSKVPWVLAIFALTQQIEGDVVLPLVMKGGAELPVVPLLIYMMFLGSFFGILGLFIAPPTLAIIRTLYIDLYLPYVESK